MLKLLALQAEQSGQYFWHKWSERSVCAALGHRRQSVVATIQCFFSIYFLNGGTSKDPNRREWKFFLSFFLNKVAYQLPGLLGSALNFLWWVGGGPTNYFVTSNFSWGWVGLWQLYFCVHISYKRDTHIDIALYILRYILKCTIWHYIHTLTAHTMLVLMYVYP
jgi:hypothetical protein